METPQASQKPFDYLQRQLDRKKAEQEEKDFKKELKAASEELYDEMEADRRELEELFSAGEEFKPSLSTHRTGGTYEPPKLNARHREILRLAALGYKQVQIAAILGIEPATVGYTIRSPLGQLFLGEIEEARTDDVKSVGDRLKEMSPLAAEVLLDIMGSGTDTNKLKAAKSVLEMTGHKPGESHTHNHLHMTAGDIEAVKEKARLEKERQLGEIEVHQAEEAPQ